MADLNETQRKRFDVLYRVYTETNANERALVDDKQLAAAMGLPQEEWLSIRNYLRGEGLINSMGMNAIHITHAGVVYVEERLAKEQQEAGADLDELTGTRRRGAYGSDIRREIQSARRTGQPLTLGILDVNKFKNINDDLGHQTGDGALRIVSGAIRASVDRKGTAYRYGGDEFAVILPNSSEPEALTVFQRIISTISQNDTLPLSHRITISVGIAVFPEDANDEQGLLRAADQAMYSAKSEGINQIRRAGRGNP